MRNLNNNTQKAQAFIDNYYNALGRYEQLGYDSPNNLYNIYKSFSQEKYNAFNECNDLKFSLNGWQGCIIGGNCHAFTYGFLYKNEQGQVCLAYITKDNNYSIIL